MWANLTTWPLNDVSQHISLTIMFGYVLFLIHTILDLFLAAAFSILVATVVRRQRNAIFLACVARVILFALAIAVVSIYWTCYCISPPIMVVNLGLIYGSDASIISTTELAVPVRAYHPSEAAENREDKTQSVEVAVLLS